MAKLSLMAILEKPRMTARDHSLSVKPTTIVIYCNLFCQVFCDSLHMFCDRKILFVDGVLFVYLNIEVR